MRGLFLSVFLVLIVFRGVGQEQMDSLFIMKGSPLYIKEQFVIPEQQIVELADKQPAFQLFRDTYFTAGIPLNKEINDNTADALFQISIRQRLTKSILPFNTFMYLTYTQKSFWDIFAESSPFRDNNYNPSLGFGRYITRDNKLVGAGFIQIAHESNGRDSLDSRSWNYLSASLKYFFNPRLVFQTELWIPVEVSSSNSDFLDYRGLGYVSLHYLNRNHKLWMNIDLNPRKGFGNINTTISIAYTVSKKSNQYLFVRYYNGYAEGMLEYNQYSHQIRFGFCIKPSFFSVY